MTPNIQIFSMDEIESRQRNLPTQESCIHLISIGDDDWGYAQIDSTRFKRVLKLSFPDLRSEKKRICKGQRLPAMDDVVKAVEFYSQIPETDTLYIHCWAGISRSTAIGLICHLHRTKDFDESLKQVIAVRKIASPNPILVKHGLELILGVTDPLKELLKLPTFD